jgi:hypothetical protein
VENGQIQDSGCLSCAEEGFLPSPFSPHQTQDRISNTVIEEETSEEGCWRRSGEVSWEANTLICPLPLQSLACDRSSSWPPSSSSLSVCLVPEHLRCHEERIFSLGFV